MHAEYVYMHRQSIPDYPHNSLGIRLLHTACNFEVQLVEVILYVHKLFRGRSIYLGG